MLFNRCAFYELPDEAEKLKPGEKGFICNHQKTLTWETARKRLGLGLYSPSGSNDIGALLSFAKRQYRTRAKK